MEHRVHVKIMPSIPAACVDGNGGAGLAAARSTPVHTPISAPRPEHPGRGAAPSAKFSDPDPGQIEGVDGQERGQFDRRNKSLKWHNFIGIFVQRYEYTLTIRASGQELL